MKLISKIHLYLQTFGFYPRKFYNSFRGIPSYIKNFNSFNHSIKNDKNDFSITRLFPCLDDRFANAGDFQKHYFLQDIYAARKIFLNNPLKHVDIGSRIDGFVAHVASFRKIEIFDIRKLNYHFPNISFTQADLMSNNFNIIDYCDSLSCLHVLEHFGLGRYGDPVDINGHIKGFNNIHKILKQGGKFYFSTPIGRQRIEFDAHRVFSLSYLLKLIEPKYKINSFAYIDDADVLHQNIELEKENISSNFNCNFGCAIFELTKL